MSPRPLASLGAVAALLLSPFAAHAEPPTLALSTLPSQSELAALLWQRSPELAAARGRIGAALAEQRRAHLLPNPGLDLSWNTIPVGPHNPEDLPFSQIPNYAVSVSELIELGKRGPRQEAAAASARASRLDAEEQLRQRYFELLDVIAEVAAAELRTAALTQLSTDASDLTELQRQRARHGDTPGLDADRAELEEAHFSSALAEEHAHLASALRTCAGAVGMPCEPFGSSERAAAFLARLPEAPGGAPTAQRPDLASLDAQAQAARAQGALARAHRIPDPTLRVGYVRDQFVAAGNQPNSLFVGASIPLPLFDQGQADDQAAAASAGAAERARTLLLESSRQQLQQLAAERSLLEQRRSRLQAHTLPLARSVVQDLQAAVSAGGAPLQELLLARRTLGETLLESADLELSAFRLASAQALTAGAQPPLPADLSASPSSTP
ncbi:MULTISPECIES: TolC family protein [Myxococcaceae]|uniref:TolC family protein n=1 Tax=Myxococcaceae TaxID=31 RepID=UPI00129D1348|nr:MULTISPECIES: TolC family protein [Myxococcaceae]MBF5041148.1 TolC family protein [Simulacricoccus sp. 17bor-14]